MPLSKYKDELLSCSKAQCESVFSKIADRYEDDLLDFDGFPDDYFEFIVQLLSDNKFYSKPGVWNFLLVLGTEFHKLKSHHYEKLAEVIIAHYQNYQNEDLCLAVCDFFARNYTLTEACLIFDRLEAIEKSKSINLHGFVADGRRIMLAEDERRRNKGK